MIRRIRRWLATPRGKITAVALFPVFLFFAIPPDLMQDISSRAVVDRHGELLRLTLSRDDKYHFSAAG